MVGHQLPELRRWGSASPDSIMIGVHGFAGGATDYEKLGSALNRLDSGLQVVSYDRSRAEHLKPPNVIGTGAIQANAAELLLVLCEIAQHDEINSLSLAGHSLGGPIIAAALEMVCSGNLPDLLSGEQSRLTEIVDHTKIRLVAPAGLTDAYALMPTGGFAAHSLGKAMLNGAADLVRDSSGIGDFLGQMHRAKRAATYLARLKFSLEECIDACGPQTLETMAGLDPDKLTIVLYDQDEIFPASEAIATLNNPEIRNDDFAIYAALTELNPADILNYLKSGSSITNITAITGLKAAAAFKDGRQKPQILTENKRRTLSLIATRAVVLPGRHTTPLTRVGAEQLAEVLSRDNLSLAA